MEEAKEFLMEFYDKNSIEFIGSKYNEKGLEEITNGLKYNLGILEKLIKLKLYQIIQNEKQMTIHLKELSINYSKIISNISQIELIKKGINFDEKKNSDNMKLKLLFKESRDGDDRVAAFHKKVDGKGNAPTISIIQTNNNFIFGGYTEHEWDNCSKCVNNNNTFMFSFNNNKIYIGKKGGLIHCENKLGPWFCNGSRFVGGNYF